MRLHQAPVSAEGSVGALGRAAPPTPPSCVKLPRRQPALGLSPASRVSSHSRPQQLSSSVVVAAAATRGREASTSTGESHASSLSPEAAKEGMQWLAKWVSSQYMGMGKSAEDAMPELRRRGVVCSDASNGQILFRVPGHQEPLDGPSVIRLLNLKARPGIKQAEPKPPQSLVRSASPSNASSEAPSPSNGGSPRGTSPSREYQVGRLPDSPDATAMRWLAEWIAANYSGLGKQAEDVLPELRRRGVVYSSIKDGRVKFRAPGVTSRIEAPQIVQMLRLQPRPGMRPSEPEPPQSLISMLSSDNRQDASPMTSRASSPSSSRSSSPSRYSSPGKTRAASSLSPEAAMLGMRWLAIFVSSQYLGMGRSAEDALPELRAMGVVCSSVRDGRPMFIMPGHPEEVDAQDVVKLLRLELRPGVRPRAPTPPPALKGNGASTSMSSEALDTPAPPSGKDMPAPPSGKPAASVEDGIKYLAAWVSQNYSGMGKTVEDVLPELRRQGVVCSSVVGTTPLYRMRGQQEMDAGSVIKALRLQARPGVDPSKPTPPPGLELGKPPGPRTPTPPSSPQRAATSTPKPPAAKAQAQPGAAAPSAGKKEATQEAPPSPSGGPKKGFVSDMSESATGQLVLPATVTLLVAAALGGGSVAIKEISKSGFFNPDRLNQQERGLPDGVPQSGSYNITGGPPYSPVKPRESMMLQAPPVGGQQNPPGVQPLDSDRGALLRAQEQEQRRVEREEMERVQREREAREQMRLQMEQQDRELRAQNMRIQEEQARLDREARASEQRQQQERARMEQQEREQREREQREQERRDREQREREQKERAQKEKEDRERAQKEERERAQKEREQKEREQREQREREMRMESESMMSPPEQPKGLLGSQKPSGVQPLPGRQTQPLQPPNQARGAESRGGVQPKASADSPSAAEAPQGVKPLSEAGKQENRAPEGPYEPPNQPKGVLPSETPTSAGKGGEDNTDVMPPSMATMMPEDPKQAAMKDSKDKWGSRTNVEKISGGEGDREEAKQAPTLPNPSRAGGLTQDQVEGYEDCLFRSIGC